MSGPDSNFMLNPQYHTHRFSLGDWDNTARVRCDHDKYCLPQALERELQTRHWFAPAFMPYLEHPCILKAGQSIILRLEANHLVYFLDYTTLLEHKIVNRAVQTLIHGELNIPVPPPMKKAALQLYTDEGYHALFSNQIAEQVAHLYGMQNRPCMPHRITRLQALIFNTPCEHSALIEFMIGFVSETVIAKELLDAARKTLVSTVFMMLKSHLEDEARHSRCFSEAFNHVWTHLTYEQRAICARALVEIIAIFFETDTHWLNASLSTVNLEQAAIQQIVENLQTPHNYCQRVRSGARATFVAMARSGFFDDSENLQLFIGAGFINA